MKREFILAMLAALSLQAQLPSNSAGKHPKDQGEYDALSKAAKAREPAQKLAAIEEWSAKYPATDYKIERLEMQLDAYRQLGDLDAVYSIAAQLRAMEPTNVSALFSLVELAPALNVGTSERVAEAEQAAEALARALPGYFANPPVGLRVADRSVWAAQRASFDDAIEKARAWAASRRRAP